MSAAVARMNDRCDTRFEADTFFNFPEECDEQRRGNAQDTHTPLPRDGTEDTPVSYLTGLPRLRNMESDVTQVDSHEVGSGFDEKLIRRKSDLLNIIGMFKSKYPDKMSLPEYMMHAYVILHTKNPNTILTYEIIMTHTKLDPDVFTKVLATQTLSRIEQEGFSIDAVELLRADFKNDQELLQMDKQFTWLCQVCCRPGNEHEETTTQFDADTPHSEYDTTQQHDRHMLYADDGKTVQDMGAISFTDLMQVSDLPNDVVYEALRLHGNRLVQRSVYGSTRRLYSGSSWTNSQQVVAKANATSAEIKGFVENIQKYSVDNKATEQYYGEERRMSTRQSALLRKKYM